MPQNNEIVAALPASGQADKELLRAWGVQRNSFNLRAGEDLRDFVMIDPDGGGTTPSVVQNGMLYGHDEDDTTTDHDGVFCLVSYDGQRYKLETGLHAPFNVLDKDLTAPPDDPAFGDAYLIFGSPTGPWAGKSGYIGIETARGWEYCLPPIGFLVYVRDEKSFYHRDDLGAWVLGTGTRTLGPNSVALLNAINFGKRFIVENQTTNTIPVSPTIEDAYICGPSWPGGASGKIAICEDGATFTIYTPSNGWSAYDKSLNNTYTFNGAAWVSSSGAWVAQQSADQYDGDIGTTVHNGTDYAYSDTVAPTTSAGNVEDTVTITHAAKRTGAKLRFEYQCRLAIPNGGEYTIALFRGSETTAVGWESVGNYAAGSTIKSVAIIEIAASDAASHVYRIRKMQDGNINPKQTRRLFSVQEGA